MNVLHLEDVQDRNIGRVLQLQSRQAADKPCLLTNNKTFTFQEVNNIVNRYALGMKQLGLSEGARVSIFMPSCPEFIFLAHAANKLGAIWVPVNTDYKEAWLSGIINDTKAHLLIIDSSLLSRFLEVAADLEYTHLLIRNAGGDSLPAEIVATDIASFEKLSAEEPDIPDIYYGDTSAILWTSGTTGKSKGVMVPHNVWIRSALNTHKLFGTRQDDIVYNCLPLYNAAAWVANIYRALVAGIPLALDPSFSASEFWGRIRHYKATETITLGAMHMFLWNAPEKNDDAGNPLRNAVVIPLPEELVEPFRQRFGLEIIQCGYGQSEANPIIERTDDGSRTWPPNALGDVSDGIEIVLLDDEGNEAGVGVPGEFCLKTLMPHIIFNGYFDNPEATRQAYHGEWYRTGDLGVKDDAGNFFFVDRKSDFIRYMGRNISSLQVEAAIRQHPAVESVACFGVPSDKLASEAEIKANIILRQGARVSEHEIARFVNDTAPYFFVPRYIEFVKDLPYTPTNKVQKYKLRKQSLSSSVWDRLHEDFTLDK